MSTATDPTLDLVPEIVRRKAAEMDAFIKGETAKMTEGVPAGETEPAKAPEPVKTPPEPPPAQPQALETTPPVPPAEPSAPPKPAPTTFAEVVTEEMTKDQRYKIMEGIQKATGRDLSRAQRENQALRDELEALKRQISAPPAAPISQPAQVAAPAADPEAETRLAEALGAANLKDLVAHLRAQGFAVTDDLKKVQDQVGTVSRTISMTAQEQFTKDMNDLTNGKWDAINKDPKFIDWMNEEDGYSGLSRREAAQNHANRMDAHKLARYFVDFAGSQAATAPTATTSTSKLDKKSLASPPATPVADTKLDDQPKMVKVSEFKQFAENVRAGKYQDLRDPEKHKQLQAKMYAEQERLDTAQRLGHVTQG